MDFLTISVTITFGVLSLSLVLSLLRILRGPALADRVVALDLVAFIVIAFIATYCIAMSQSVYLDAAVVLALIAFLGTIAFARFISLLKTKKESHHD